MLTDRWTQLSETLPHEYLAFPSLEVAIKRFIYGFGGQNKHYRTPDDNIEYIVRLDSFIVRKGWDVLTLKSQ